MSPQGTVPASKDRSRDMRAKTTSRYVSKNPEPMEDDEEEDLGPPGFLQYCWPAIFGIILGVIASQIWDKINADYGTAGLRLVFPYVRLLGRPELGLGPQLTKNLPQLFLYLQFPLEGFLISFFISRGTRYGRALVQIGFVHFIAAFVLWLLTKPGATHGM